MDKLLVKIKKIIPVKVFKAMQPAYHFLIAWFSAFVYRHPSEEIIVIGVTGTTGKTTSAYLIAKMLENAGYKTGFTSTAMFNDGNKEWMNDKKMTMIGRLFTQKILRDMVNNGCKFAIVETTSEGVVQFRHRFINYDILVFTGLYPEHIDSHGSFENYKQAKGKLFEHLKDCKNKFVNSDYEVKKAVSGLKKTDLKRIKKTSILNGDDEHYEFFNSFWSERNITFKIKGEKSELIDENIEDNIVATNIEVNSQGTSFDVRHNRINLQLLGEFNVVNALTAISVGYSQDFSIDDIKRGIEMIKGVAGRLEKIDMGQNFTVIVDYAFEPNAVKKLYKTIDLIPHNRIIHVLGATGGGRDIARRPILGELAGKNANLVIITNEDPYDDDPEIIIDQVSLGAEKKGKKENVDLFKILDRGKAIKKALILAEEGDVVLITGKGNEQAICVANGEKLPWDDRVKVREFLQEIA